MTGPVLYSGSGSLKKCSRSYSSRKAKFPRPELLRPVETALAWGLFPSIKRDRQVTAKLNIRDWRENSVISEPTRLILLPGEVASGRGYGVLSFQRTVSGADER